MYSSTFTFKKGMYDADFYAMDNVIAQTARNISGYLGEETWENQETGLISNVYYWTTLDALQTLMNDPVHRQAKQAQSRWLDGYHIVIAEIIGTHGDGQLPHPLHGKHVTLPG